MSYHAELSPSGSKRWMMCPGSIAGSRGIKRKSSTAANEGTAAHQLGEWCLRQDNDAVAYLTRIITVERDGEAPEKFEVTEEMAEAVQSYVDYCRALRDTLQGTLVPETDVSIEHITGEEGATGQSDCVILSPRRLDIVDLKYGRRFVDAEDNSQLTMYAGGALRLYEDFEDFEEIWMHVAQPNIGGWTKECVTPAELQRRLDVIAAAAKATRVADAPRVPGEHCKFCPMAEANACPERSAMVAEAVFDDLDALDKPVYTAVKVPDLAVAVRKLGLVKQWIKHVEETAFAMAMQGTPVEGTKLVQGRQGNRKYVEGVTPEAAVAAGLPESVVYSRELRSPAQLEKAAGKALKPVVQAFLAANTTRSEGGFSLVMATDDRPAISRTTFGNLEDEGV